MTAQYYCLQFLFILGVGNGQDVFKATDIHVFALTDALSMDTGSHTGRSREKYQTVLMFAILVTIDGA